MLNRDIGPAVRVFANGPVAMVANFTLQFNVKLFYFKQYSLA